MLEKDDELVEVELDEFDDDEIVDVLEDEDDEIEDDDDDEDDAVGRRVGTVWKFG